MKKKKSVRILAIIGIVLLVALYASTLVFALLNSPRAFEMLMASIFGTILIPTLIYVYQMMYRVLSGKGAKKNNEKKGI